MIDKTCRLFIKHVRKLESIHEFAPSYFVAALCLVLFTLLIVGALLAYMAGWHLGVSFLLSVVATLLLHLCLDVLTDVNMTKLYRDDD